EPVRGGRKLSGVNEAHPERNFFGAGDLRCLAAFESADKRGGLKQAVGRSRVEPGIAAAHDFDAKLASIEIGAVDVGDFKLSTPGGLDARGNVDHPLIIKIEAGHGPVRPGLGGLLLYAECPHPIVEFDDAIA